MLLIGRSLHELAPQQLFLAHLAPYLNDTKTQLDGKMSQVQNENAHLIQSIKEQEAEIEKMVHGLENIITDLDNGSATLHATTEDGTLRREAREIDGEIAMRRDEQVSRL